jgi:hypothetical protein
MELRFGAKNLEPSKQPEVNFIKLFTAISEIFL